MKSSDSISRLFLILLGLSTATQAASAPKRAKNVPKEAKWCNGSWFQVVGAGVSWKDAKKKCEAAGGNLAVVADEATWKELKAMIPNEDYWLGASDLEEKGKWKWVDGTSMSYAPWRSGEPNNAGGSEHCLVTSWGDVPEVYSWCRGYVCQWKTFDSIIAYRSDVEDASPETAAVLKQFRLELVPAQQAHRAAVIAADGVYATALVKEMDAAGKRNAVEVAAAIQAELDLVKSGALIPDDAADTPAPLVKLRKVHREQCWKADDDRNSKVPAIARRCDQALDKIQAKFLRESAVAKALEIKALRQSMQPLGL